EVFSSLLDAFSAAAAHSSKSAGAPRHHCACAVVGASISRPPIAATESNAPDAVPKGSSLTTRFPRDCRPFPGGLSPRNGAFFSLGFSRPRSIRIPQAIQRVARGTMWHLLATLQRARPRARIRISGNLFRSRDGGDLPSPWHRDIRPDTIVRNNFPPCVFPCRQTGWL